MRNDNLVDESPVQVPRDVDDVRNCDEFEFLLLVECLQSNRVVHVELPLSQRHNRQISIVEAKVRALPGRDH